MTSPVLTENRWSGGFMVSEATGERARDGVVLLQQTYTPPAEYSQGGTILGQVLDGTSATYHANSGNTGNFTCSAVTVAQGVLEGTYKGELISATEFQFFDPNGALVGEGAFGAAFSGEGLGFTITAGGTPGVVGDGFTIVMAANANVGLYAPLSLTAADGTQIPAGILFNTIDASQGNTKVTIIDRAAEVNGSELIYPSGASGTQMATINAQLLSLLGIKVR